MSGGVDSSVAAFLLKKQGYEVVGVFMRCWSQRSSDALGIGVPCGTERDSEDARRVAEKLRIPFYVWDFEKEYKEKVVAYMIDGYRRGITPNPDVMCNREIKFGLFLKKALESGADFVATGHYVRRKPKFPIINDQFSNNIENLEIENSLKIGNCKLKIAKDANKDQSYFLWTLTQKQLKHCLFPIGDYLKSEVRKIARGAGLPTAGKKDSQGICFLGKVTLSDFLKQYIPEKRGEVLMTSGEKIGEHDGSWFYTVGQRHIGAKFQILNSKFQKPFYVSEKNIKTNTITVAEGSESPALYKNEIELTDVSFVNNELGKNKELRMSVLARVRYRQPMIPAVFIIHNSKFKIQFDQPVKFVAPGQSTVFYAKNGEMLGGGVIC